MNFDRQKVSNSPFAKNLHKRQRKNNFEFRKMVICSLQAVSLICVLPGCLSSKNSNVVESTDDGQSVTLQMASDEKSVLAVERKSEAKQAREELIARGELSSQLMNSVAELSLLAGNPDQAEKEAREVLKKEIKNTDAVTVLVKVAIYRNRHKEAVLLADNGLAIDPRDADLLSIKGLALYKIGDSSAAKSMWQKALQQKPTHISSLLNLATLHYHNQNLAQAGTAFEKVLTLQSENADAMVGKALVLSAQGQPESARILLVDQLKKTPQAGLVLYNLAIIEKEKFQNFKASLEYTSAYLDSSKKDRKQTEKLIVQKEELKALVAKQQGPLSDEQLRQMASTSARSQRVASSDSADPLAEEPSKNGAPMKTAQTQSEQKVNKQAMPKETSLAAKPEVNLDTNDTQSLEDFIK